MWQVKVNADSAARTALYARLNETPAAQAELLAEADFKRLSAATMLKQVNDAAGRLPSAGKPAPARLSDPQVATETLTSIQQQHASSSAAGIETPFLSLGPPGSSFGAQQGSTRASTEMSHDDPSWLGQSRPSPHLAHCSCFLGEPSSTLALSCNERLE